MKKIFAVLLLMVAFSATTVVGVGVSIDGAPVDFGVQPPVIVDGRTLVPVRGVFERLDFDVEWLAEERAVRIANFAYELRIYIDSEVFYVNGAPRALDVPAQIIGGRTMLPIRQPLEAVGLEVGWENNEVTVRPPAREDIIVATVNDRNVYWSEVSFHVPDAERILGAASDAELRTKAIQLAAVHTLIAEFAEQHGIYLTQYELDEIQDEIVESIDFFDAETWRELLRADRIYGFEHLEQVLQIHALSEKVLNEIIIDEEKFALFADFYEEEEILGAKHILIRVEDFEDEEEAMEFATEIWERAADGEDFSALIEEYGNDPGMAANPDGYTFTAGVMVPEFEEGTRNLEIGEISEPIRAFHGIHIIKRVEPNPDNIMGGSPPEIRRMRATWYGFQAKAETANIVFLPEL